MASCDMAVFAIGVCFGNRISFEKRLRYLFKRLRITPYIFIVDNYQEFSAEKTDNTNWLYEFSAYLHGLNMVLASIPSRGFSQILVLNDTIFCSHNWLSVKGYITLIYRILLTDTCNSFTGIHSALPASLYSHTLKSFYLSTFIFGLSVDKSTLQKLTQYFSRPLSISLVRPYLSIYHSLAYSELIDKWLLSPGILSGWHGANPFIPPGQHSIDRKKVAIACEFMMPFYLCCNDLVYRPLFQNRSFRFYYLLDRFSGLISKIRKRYSRWRLFQ